MTYNWRLIRSGSCSPAWNMAVDEALFLFAKKKDRQPTLRLFRWEPAAVSIGHFQDIATQEIKEYLALGYPLVRRPTGGLTVLHDGDLSYSIVGLAGEAGISRSPRGMYRQAHEALQQALSPLGLRPDLYAGDEKRTLAGLCNAVPMRSDLIVDGSMKIAGSAQVRGEGAVLQHGCIHVPKGIDPDLFEQEVPGAFGRTMDLVLLEATLSPEERELAAALEAHKYSSDEWNLHGRETTVAFPT